MKGASAGNGPHHPTSTLAGDIRIHWRWTLP